MKKQILVLLAVAACFQLSAQTDAASKANPGGVFIKGGLNFSNISNSANGSVDDSKTLPSFNIGVIADIPLAPVLSFQTGLAFTGKGSKTNVYLDNNNHDDNYYKVKFMPYYLQLPADLVIKLPLANEMRLYVGGGAYAAMGLFGKTKTEAKILGATTTSTQDIKFNNDDPTTSEQEDAGFNKLRRFDYGLNALAGVEAGRLRLGLGYDLGMAKINSKGDNDTNNKNKYRVWSVNVGIRL